MSEVTVIPLPAPVLLPIAGETARFPVRRVYCVGRNYAAHAREMGGDPNREAPFFFQKNPDNLVPQPTTIPYPPQSSDVHHEVELVVALAGGGRDIPLSDALDKFYGYAVGVDLTRRDLQGEAKKAGRPWESGKAFESSGPLSALVPASRIGHPQRGAITLDVNGERRQTGDLDELIWTVPEIIATLSTLFTLAPGDVIFTGTPSGVGPVICGDRIDCAVAGLADLSFTIA